MSNQFLNRQERKIHLKFIKSHAGRRYSPELNVELPISKIFDGLRRSKLFYSDFRLNYGKLRRAYKHLPSEYKYEHLQHQYNTISVEYYSFQQLLDNIKSYDAETIPLLKISSSANKLMRLIWDFSEMISKLDADRRGESTGVKARKSLDEESHLRFIRHSLNELIMCISFFSDIARDHKFQLSNKPFLSLVGRAGIGKTHLFCDLVNQSKDGSDLLPALMVFADRFNEVDPPLTQIINQLSLQVTAKQFLRMFDRAGKESKCRALLIIDAINETRSKTYWKKNLKHLVGEIQKYPNIAMVISARSGFESVVMTKEMEKFFVRVEHEGFRFVEWEAVKLFFNEYDIPHPNVPLLSIEFEYPLFLRLFCEGYKKRSRKVKKEQIRGHEGTTYIFESFVDKVSESLSEKYNLSTKPKENVWDLVIEKIAKYMAVNHVEAIPENSIKKIIQIAYPDIQVDDFLADLENNMLLFKFHIYQNQDADSTEHEYRFPFQKFSDHLIARFIFIDYEREFGKSNKCLSTARVYFSRRRKIGKKLSKPWSFGVVEALSVQCPEHLKGVEFVEVAPYLKNSKIGQEAFIESLVWRKVAAFSHGCENTKDYINKTILKKSHYTDYFLNALLQVASLPKHPFNADKLHEMLLPLSMAKRDALWSIFLHWQFGEKSSVDRLLEWAWSEHDKEMISDQSILLISTALAWFLTTSNRYVRDKATKALVALLTGRLTVLISLLKKFSSVNDPYLSERLFGVAYGCVVRQRQSCSEIKVLAELVYAQVFETQCYMPNILLRDYARSVIEVARNRNISLKLDYKKVIPPYGSNWPKKNPTENELRNIYQIDDDRKQFSKGVGQIWGSVMHHYGHLADFGRYILGSAVGHWSGRKLGNQQTNREELFDAFKLKLTPEQKNLLDEAMTFYWSSLIQQSLDREEIKSGSSPNPSRGSDVFTEFESSISISDQRYFVKFIKPFISHCGIDDPSSCFDIGLAQRWVFRRVMQLGYSTALHGQFDTSLNHSHADRSENKPERIGKKYQWIALFELLARISDNFTYKKTSWSQDTEYKGAWQLSIRDIDVTSTLKPNIIGGCHDLPVFDWASIDSAHLLGKNKISDSSWLRDVKSLPRLNGCLSYTDSEGDEWIVLGAHYEWETAVPPETERYEVANRQLFYIVNSYLVRNADFNTMFKWAKRQSFNGRWMPESDSLEGVYLGEYPWSAAFECIDADLDNGLWLKHERCENVPVNIALTDNVLNSSHPRDCSFSEMPNIRLPSKFIVDTLGLANKFLDGRMYDKNDVLVSFDPCVFGLLPRNCLFFRKKQFVKFLTDNNLSIVWTLQGEKNILAGGLGGAPRNWLNISGAYALNIDGEIVGRKKHEFIGES